LTIVAKINVANKIAPKIIKDSVSLSKLLNLFILDTIYVFFL